MLCDYSEIFSGFDSCQVWVCKLPSPLDQRDLVRVSDVWEFEKRQNVFDY